MVLKTPEADAVWVTWKGIRDDGLNALECTIFRNESQHLSSDMIKYALTATIDTWGGLPQDGLITYVDKSKVQSNTQGFGFLIAGFKKIGRSKSKGLLLLQYKPEGVRFYEEEM